jgi:hypothetical protein
VGYGVSLVLLACRGLDHHPCSPLCDQEDETINDRSLVGGLCFYSAVLVPVVGLQNLSPQPGVESFDEW